MREIILVVAIIAGLAACGKDPGTSAATPPQVVTLTETQTLPCSVAQISGGALISCPDGTSVEVKGGDSCSSKINRGHHDR